MKKLITYSNAVDVALGEVLEEEHSSDLTVPELYEKIRELKQAFRDAVVLDEDERNDAINSVITSLHAMGENRAYKHACANYTTRFFEELAEDDDLRLGIAEALSNYFNTYGLTNDVWEKEKGLDDL